MWDTFPYKSRLMQRKETLLPLIFPWEDVRIPKRRFRENFTVSGPFPVTRKSYWLRNWWYGCSVKIRRCRSSSKNFAEISKGSASILVNRDVDFFELVDFFGADIDNCINCVKNQKEDYKIKTVRHQEFVKFSSKIRSNILRMIKYDNHTHIA